MGNYLMEDFIRSEVEEILKYKWTESQKAGQDIGSERACREWISQHADAFQIWWYTQQEEKEQRKAG